MFSLLPDQLLYFFDGEEVCIEPWGPNALRIRAKVSTPRSSKNWALDNQPPKCNAQIEETEKYAQITNDAITASISKKGKIVVRNQHGKTLLEEYVRHRDDPTDPKASALMIPAREFKPILGAGYHLTYRIESLDPSEKIFGMGQYQQPFLDLKGTDLELAQRNSQASVPFLISSLGYGLLWNNPAIGRAVFGKNVMSFEAKSTDILDILILAGDTPADIVHAYAAVTGKPPMMPESCLGFWQSKLRYESQEELLQVAREYHKRELPLDVIVCDAYHWPQLGTFRFDPEYWPDPEAMIRELRAMNIELLVSHWPHVDKTSENYEHMLEHGMLVRQDRGLRITASFQGETVYPDFTNPATRQYIWTKMKQNYYEKGVRLFWLDEAEPEYDVYDFDIYRYYLGPVLKVGNIFPREYARAFYDGLKQEGQEEICNLVRCAWAGSQKFGTLLWSGDIASSWNAFKCQVVAGLNVSLAGISWWTTDIGGFHGGDASDPAFRELCTRWFQFGCFCPVFRIHGDREPKPVHGVTTVSGGPNEPWSFGEEHYLIMAKYLRLRERLRPYVRDVMRQAHEHGTPVIRTMFFEFPSDAKCWEIEDQYMFGSRYLCAPVLEAGLQSRRVYLPPGVKWKQFDDGDLVDAHVYEGGQWVDAPCPIEKMPVFERI